MLEARDIVFERRGKRILFGVSLSAVSGQVIALCGPNGAGKSSLLSVLAGDAAPTSGSVLIEDRAVAALRPMELARRRAVLEQAPSLSVDFTVAETVALGAEVAPFEKASSTSAMVERAMRLAGVESYASVSVLHLSGGERGRTHLARVLAQHFAGSLGASPGALLLDEPTASLDLAHQAETLAIARQCARDGAAVVVVLHDLNLAAAFADRIALLADGEIVALDAPSAVLTPEILGSVYGVSVRVDADASAGGALRVAPDFRSAAARIDAIWNC